MKIDKSNPTLILISNLRNLSFFSSREEKNNKKLNIHLSNKILYSFIILNLISQKLSYKIDTLYTELLYKIENVNFSI